MVKICVVVAAAVIVVSVVVIIVGVKIGSEIAEIYQLLLLFFCFTLVVVVDPKNLHSKFGPIGAVTAEIMLMLSWWVGGGGWWRCKIIFVSNPTFELSWGCDNS